MRVGKPFFVPDKDARDFGWVCVLEQQDDGARLVRPLDYIRCSSIIWYTDGAMQCTLADGHRKKHEYERVGAWAGEGDSARQLLLKVLNDVESPDYEGHLSQATYQNIKEVFRADAVMGEGRKVADANK